VRNNLIIVENGGRVSYEFGTIQGNVFENNLFAGRHEGLPQGEWRWQRHQHSSAR
jgi:hypothetical protein